jgi:hypothetical protein
VVHRDLKPDNILMDGQGRPRIADLGLARTQQGDDRMTATGLAMGTPAYMSPEQANGAPDLDGRSDIYSLAATGFALLAGRPPFSGPTPYATVNQVLNDPPPDLRSINPRVSAAVAAVLTGAMAKSPGQRPPTAKAFAAALEAARDGRAPARQRAPQSAAPGHRAWWLAGGAVAAVALVGVALALLDGTGHRARDPAPAPAPIPWKPVREVAPAPPPAPATASGGGEGAGAPAAKNPVKALRQLKRSLRGTVLDAFTDDLAAVRRATLAALAQQGLAVDSDEHDATQAHIEADLSDGATVTVTLTPMDGGGTQAAVQIGAFGDEARSRAVLGWIRQAL